MMSAITKKSPSFPLLIGLMTGFFKLSYRIDQEHLLLMLLSLDLRNLQHL